MKMKLAHSTHCVAADYIGKVCDITITDSCVSMKFGYCTINLVFECLSYKTDDIVVVDTEDDVFIFEKCVNSGLYMLCYENTYSELLMRHEGHAPNEVYVFNNVTAAAKLGARIANDSRFAVLCETQWTNGVLCPNWEAIICEF